MIDSALVDALRDHRLTPIEKNVLTALHTELDYFRFRPVKIWTAARNACCSRPKAFKALVRLTALGYLDVAPKPRKPRHYRLLPPVAASLPPETSQAA